MTQEDSDNTEETITEHVITLKLARQPGDEPIILAKPLAWQQSNQLGDY